MHLKVSKLSLTVISSRFYFQSLHFPSRGPSARLSVRFDKELAINLTLSINVISFLMFFPFSCFFIDIGTEQVMHFPDFFPNDFNCPSNSSAGFMILKW